MLLKHSDHKLFDSRIVKQVANYSARKSTTIKQ